MPFANERLAWGALLAAALFSGCASQSSSRRDPAPVAPAVAAGTTQTQYYQPAPVAPPERPEVSATATYSPADAPPTVSSSAIMIDAQTGRVLFEKNANYPRPVASTQKLLTAMLISEAGNLQQKVTVTEAATQCEPTKLSLKVGEQYTRYELLKAIMVKSANDAAAALAIDHSGSVSAFAAAMTRKAYSLGAANSHFTNPHGLPDPGQYSTARDMAIVAFSAYRDPVLRRLMALPQTTFVYEDGRQKNLEATNKLLSRSTTYTGMKTGFTNASGRCLISSAQEGGREIILVQLGGTRSVIFDDAERLLQWQLRRGNFFGGFAGASPAEPGTN